MSWTQFSICEEGTSHGDVNFSSALFDVQSIGTLLKGELDNFGDGNVNQFSNSNNPKVCSALTENKNLVLAVDRSLLLLENCGSEPKKIVRLDYDCDALCYRPDGKQVIIADSSGTINILDCSDGTNIFSHNLISSNGHEKIFSSVFCIDDTNKGYYCFGAAMTNGKVCIFRNIDLDTLDKGCRSRDPELIKQVQQSMIMQQFNTSSVHSSLRNICGIKLGTNLCYLTMGKGESVLALWEEEDCFDLLNQENKEIICTCEVSYELFANSSNISFVKSIYCDQYNNNGDLYCLGSNGCIYQFAVDSYSLCLCRAFGDQTIKDFTICEALNKQSSRQAYFIEEKCSALTLSVYNIPKFEKVFSVNFEQIPVGLFSVSPSSADELVFITGEATSLSDDVDQISVRTICKALPEDRLDRLIHKSMFDQALQFAKDYKLDVQKVYECKANFLVQLINESYQFDVDVPSKHQELIECLESVESDMLVSKICAEAVIPDLQMTYKLLTMGRTRLDNYRMKQQTHDQDDDEAFSLSEILGRYLSRLVTYQLVFGSISFQENADNQASSWLHFRDASLPLELFKLITSGNLAGSTQILTRHKAELLSFFKYSNKSENGPSTALLPTNADSNEIDVCNKLQSLFHSIPDDIDIDYLVTWLEDTLIPTLITKIPFSEKVIAGWLCDKVEVLENVSKDWPGNALKLASTLFNVKMKLVTSGFQSFGDKYDSGNNESNTDSSALEKLGILVSKLQQIVRLKDRYRFTVTLNEIDEESTMSLTYRMLDRVLAPEMILRTLENNIRPYIREQNLDENEVLLGYIENSLRKCEGIVERRIVAIIEALSDDHVKLKATSMLAERAAIPWSNEVSKLVKSAISEFENNKSTSAYVTDLDKEKKDCIETLKQREKVSDLPKMKAEYGFEGQDTENTPKHMQDYKHFIMFLVQHKDKTAFDQAVLYSSTFSDIDTLQVYKYKLIQLIKNNDVNSCVTLLDKAFSDNFDLALSIVESCVGLCVCALSELNKIWMEDRIKYCRATIRLIERSLDRCKTDSLLSTFKVKELTGNLTMFKNILSLQSKYNKCFSVQEYMSVENQDKCLQKVVSGMQEGNPQTEQRGQGDAFVQSMTTTIFNNMDRTVVKDQDLEEVYDTQDVLNYTSLLGIPSKTLHSKITISAAKSGEFKRAIELCHELLMFSPCPETADVALFVITACIKRLTVMKNIKKCTDDLLKLCALSTACCAEDGLMKFADISAYVHLCKVIYKSVNTNRNSFLLDTANTVCDDFQPLNSLNDFYEEKSGILLNLEETNQIVSSLTSMAMKKEGMLQSVTKTDFNTLQLIRELVSDTIMVFQRGNQSLLSFHLTVYCSLISQMHLANSNAVVDGKLPRVNLEAMSAGLDECSEILSVTIEELAVKILNNKHPDTDLAVGLLTSMTLKKSAALIKRNIDTTSRNYQRLMSYATAGLNLLKLHEMESEMAKFQSFFLNAYWGYKLSSLDIDFKGFMFSSSSSKINMLPIMIRHPKMTGNLIKQFCVDYDLDVNRSLLEFATVLVSDTEFTITESKSPLLPLSAGLTDDNKQLSLNSPQSTFFLKTFCGKEVLDSKNLSKNDESKEYRGRPWAEINMHLKFVSDNVSDPYVLCDELVRIADKQIHPYAYKRLKCVLQVVQQHNVQHLHKLVKKALDLIQNLKEYKRKRAMGPNERQWFALMYGLPTPPTLSNLFLERLPIQPLLKGDAELVWEILNPELNEETVHHLLPVAQLLDLNTDELYMKAATNITNHYLENDKSSVNKEKIETIRRLVADMTSLHLSTAVAKGLADVLPTSQDKVEAYDWCIDLAIKWLKSLPDDDPNKSKITNTLKGLKQYSNKAATELILKNFSLLSTTTQHLIESPQKLIVTLYKDDSVVERYNTPNKVYPDIHEAANQIAKIHKGCDISLIRNHLIVEWLLYDSDQKQSDEEDSTINLANKNINLSSENDQMFMMTDNLIRLLYVLSYNKDNDDTAETLIKIINRDDHRITTSVQAKGFYCLLKMFPDYLQKSKRCAMKDLKVNLQILTFVAELESVGFALKLQQFSSCDKAELAANIVKSPRLQRNGKAIRTAAEICRVFSVWCPKTWYIILQRLVSAHQVVYLHQLLREINWNPVICSLQCLPTVWQSCVMQPLVKMTPPLNKEEIKSCVACYNFLFECPVLLQIDLKTIAHHFCNIDLPLLAMGCLLCNPFEVKSAQDVASSRIHNLDEQLERLDMKNHPIAGQTLILDCIKSLNNQRI